MRANITQYVNNKFEPKMIEKGLFYLSAEQTSGLSVSDPVQFDSASLNQGVSFDSGNYQFTLKANKTYHILCPFRGGYSSASGTLALQIYDTTNSAYLGFRGLQWAQTATGNNGTQPLAVAEVTPSTDIVIEVRIAAATDVSSIKAEDTSISIIEISNFKQPSQYPFLVASHGYDLSISGTNWTTDFVDVLYLKDLSGNWWAIINIDGTLSAAATDVTLTIDELVFIDTYDLALSCRVNSGSEWGSCQVNSGGSTITLNSSGSRTGWHVTGIIRLKQKPSNL